MLSVGVTTNVLAMGVAGAKGNNAQPGPIWLSWAEFGLSLAIVDW